MTKWQKAMPQVGATLSETPTGTCRERNLMVKAQLGTARLSKASLLSTACKVSQATGTMKMMMLK